MKRQSLLVAGALAAGLITAPIVYAQSTSGSSATQRSPTDGRAGGTAPPSSTSGATPSTQPNQDMGTSGSGMSRDRDRMGNSSTSRDAGTARGASPSGRSAATDGRSPTDGRAGGTAPMTGPGQTTVPSAAPSPNPPGRSN